MATVAGTQTVTPTKTGWHLVQFANGWAAVVRWAAGTATQAAHWAWGSLTPPTSPITSITYLAPTINDLAQPAGQTQWGQAMRELNPSQQVPLLGSLDQGSISRGRPAMVDAAGKFQGDVNQFLGSAVPSNIVPSPSVPNPLDTLSTIWTWLTTPAHWLRILEAIGGAVAIYFAIKSLTGVETPKISITKAAAAVAA